LRSYDPLENHFLAIYEHSRTGWEQVNRLELENADILSPGSVKQVRFGNQENQDPLAWLQVESGVGAHGGCYDLLSFDGRELDSVLSNCASGPQGGALRDLNGDGVPEVLLNGSENYVFCYACGVRIFYNQVWRWDGEKMVEVQLARLPRPAPEELSQLNDRAIELAQAELWKDARQEIGKALDLAPQDPTVAWNAALIDLHAETRRIWAQQSPYPLLSLIFYGDYAAAMDILRPYNPNQLFNPRTPLVAGTVAEGWEQALKEWVSLFAGKALEAEPNLAAAYFLRGWASYVADPKYSRAGVDIQRAVQLDPSDPLFLDSAVFLKQ
jgi:hypothetical protein